MKSILIIEDDVDINNMLTELLKRNGYQTTAAYSGTEGLMCFGHSKFDMILLDLMLPGKSGEQVISEIRAKSNMPVIVLTAVAHKESVVGLLKSGANDYVTKPFDNDELLARIDVQLRNHTILDKNISYKDIVLNLEQYDAFIEGTPVSLSKKEFEILKLMMSNPKKVFTKNNIYESVWNEEFLGDENTVNVHISKIRSKLAKMNPDTEYIQTVWGIGFKLF